MKNQSQIKKIPLADTDAFIDIVANAYPSFRIFSPEEKKKTRTRLVKHLKDPTINHYGLYRHGKLLGGMRTYDFTMNLFSMKTLVGGVGLVAVDLLHKKEKVCKELISFFIDLYKKKDVPIVALYPFRPDFYRKMGFGYGTKLNLYKIRPGDLPRGTSKKHIRFLNQQDRKAFRQCCYRYFLKHHGMFEIKNHEIDYFFKRPEAKTIVYEERSKILGYLSFVFEKVADDNMLRNNIVIRELIYENRDVFLELVTFLQNQLDQITQVFFPTQDEFFHFLLLDPRDGSENLIPILGHQTNTQGVGIMYRVIDTRGVFELLKDHNFGNQNCRLRLFIRDSFLKDNEGELIVHFKGGRPSVKRHADFDVEVRIDVADFSSLLMGSVNYHSLFEYGLSDISDKRYVDNVTKIFGVEQKPICHTIF
jgi:predicted acetyltransferase